MLANMLIATAELVEAEGRVLRRHVARLSTAIVLIAVAGILGLLGIGFLLYGLFGLLAERMSHPAAAACFGLVGLALSGAIAWIARSIIR